MMKKKDVLDELIVNEFNAKSSWSGKIVTLTFGTSIKAMEFQNAMQKPKGCLIKETGKKQVRE